MDGDEVFTATYDARTRRLSKTEGAAPNAQTTLYRYDGGTNFQELEDGGSGYAVATELIRAGGLGGGIGSVLYTDKSIASTPGPVEHFVYNAVGHTVALTNGGGSLTQTSLYEAFGDRVVSTGTSSNNRLANTKERDASIGLDNHGFRYYDPESGRYVTRDPIGYGDGMNVYASVHNNPINHVDPLGLETDEPQVTPMQGTFPLLTGSLGAYPNRPQSMGSLRDRPQMPTREWPTTILPQSMHTAGRFVGDIVIPRPDQSYQAAQQQADIMFAPDTSASDRFAAGAGVLGNTIFTALDVIPVVGGIRRKVASSSAEGLGGRITRQADEAAELAERGLKRGADIAPESTGIVYKRTDPKTGEEYVGKSKSPERFEARKGEHDRKLGAEHEYEILDRAPTGKPLDVAEETKIRELGGLQREGGNLANKRHEMSERRYREAGGEVDDPNR